MPIVSENADLVTDFFARNSYSWLDRMFERWRNKLFFTTGGKARLANIAGYILGHHHAGNTEFASQLAESLISTMDRFVGEPTEIQCNIAPLHSLDVITETFSVPGSKCILGDDGTWGGFTLLWLHLVHPDKYREIFQRHMLQDEDTEISPHRATKETLQIRETVSSDSGISELTQYAWSKETSRTIEMYYAPSYNGGLLYHGPGAGETFAVTLNKCLWSVHT